MSSSRNFRIKSLTANSANFADPNLLSHTLRQSVTNSNKRIGGTDAQLNRAEMKEITPRMFTDGSGVTKVDQVVTVAFSGYSDDESVAALIGSWNRMKVNVDAAIADRMLQGFTSQEGFVAEIGT